MNTECGLPPLILSMPIQTIVRQWPQTARIFLKYRMSCVGCALEAFDSLDEALCSYTIPVDAFLSELCDLIRTEEPT